MYLFFFFVSKTNFDGESEPFNCYLDKISFKGKAGTFIGQRQEDKSIHYMNYWYLCGLRVATRDQVLILCWDSETSGHFGGTSEKGASDIAFYQEPRNLGANSSHNKRTKASGSAYSQTHSVSASFQPRGFGPSLFFQGLRSEGVNSKIQGWVLLTVP